MRAVSGNGLGTVLHGDGGTLACTLRVLQPPQPLQVGKAWVQPLGLGGAPLQFRAGLPPKSLQAWLCKCIYLTELPKPGAESPQTSIGKHFTPYKVSSQPTSSGRAGWLGHAHCRLASPAWGSFPSQWRKRESSLPAMTQPTEEQSCLPEARVPLLWL